VARARQALPAASTRSAAAVKMNCPRAGTLCRRGANPCRAVPWTGAILSPWTPVRKSLSRFTTPAKASVARPVSTNPARTPA